MLKTRVSPFEYEVLKRLKGLNFEWDQSRILVAVSGGRDSVALLNLLFALKTRLKFELAVAHVHHGHSTDKAVASYRIKTASFVKRLASNYNLEFHLIQHDGPELKSEADFRKVREALLESCRKRSESDWLAFAHHSDDLLETRLIRLIRGTGAQGLQAMNLTHG